MQRNTIARRLGLVAGVFAAMACGDTAAPEGERLETRSLEPTVSSIGVLFESTWDTEAGTSNNAVTDGGRWPNYWEFNNGLPVQLLSVVAGGPGGHNALRVQQRGELFAANVQVDDIIPASTDYYVRYYMRNDDISFSGDHVVTVDTWHYPNLTYMRKSSSLSGWNFVISAYSDPFWGATCQTSAGYPFFHWGPWQAFGPTPPPQLAAGQWYRMEYWVHFTSDTSMQVHPRVYDASGALIFDDDDFLQEDYTGVAPDNWTLASYYAAGRDFCVDPAWMNDFGMGNNGQAGATDTGLYWYFAGVQIRDDTWPGPIN